tara:strand:- start:521 stop:679 length:159 start_codon:yes stop_codon:yes gene_type:complete
MKRKKIKSKISKGINGVFILMESYAITSMIVGIVVFKMIKDNIQYRCNDKSA